MEYTKELNAFSPQQSTSCSMGKKIKIRPNVCFQFKFYQVQELFKKKKQKRKKPKQNKHLANLFLTFSTYWERKPFPLGNYLFDKYYSCFKQILFLLPSSRAKAYFKWKDLVRYSNDQCMCWKQDIQMVEVEGHVFLFTTLLMFSQILDLMSGSNSLPLL